jgi:hypothetical protein
MGRTQSGPLGQVSGKVGPVVFSTWNGVDYVRAMPRFKKNRQLSEKQIAQLAKFKLVGDFVKTMADLFAITFKDFKGGMTGSNSAFAQVMNNAVTGIYPNFQLDYSKALISHGRLPIGNTTPIAVDPAGLLNFQWTDDSVGGLGSAKGDDKAILVAWCEEMGRCIYSIGPAVRSATQATLALQSFKGKTVHSWLAFISADGKKTSPSAYMGSILVP